MWRWTISLLAACSFTHGLTSDASGPASGSDAPTIRTDARALDAPSYHACGIGPTGTTSDAGLLGSATGGSMVSDLACNAGELPVGMGFDFTSSLVNGNEPSVIVAHVRCAAFQRDTAGNITTTLAELESTPVLAPCATTSSVTEQDCPAGQVLVGMAGNLAGTSLYNTVVLKCAPLDAMLDVSATASTLTFAGTGNYSDHPQTAPCPANTAFTTFGVRAGCGNDALAPRCQPLACQ